MFSEITFTNIAVVVGTLLVSLGFHEAMHAFVAHSLGDDTAQREGRLTLNPLRHIDIFTTVLLPTILLLMGLPPILAAKPVPFNPSRVKYEEFGAALVGLAGPFTNLGLATVVAMMVNFGMLEGVLLQQIAGVFIWINIGIFVFNMLPIPPLDGSRLLYAFAPDPVRDVMERIEQFGVVFVLAIFLLLIPVVGPVLLNIDQAIFNFLII